METLSRQLQGRMEFGSHHPQTGNVHNRHSQGFSFQVLLCLFLLEVAEAISEIRAELTQHRALHTNPQQQPLLLLDLPPKGGNNTQQSVLHFTVLESSANIH